MSTQRALFDLEPVPPLTCMFGTPVGIGLHQTCEGCDRSVAEAHEAMQVEIAAGRLNRQLFTLRQWTGCGFKAEDWASAPGFQAAPRATNEAETAA